VGVHQLEVRTDCCQFLFGASQPGHGPEFAASGEQQLVNLLFVQTFELDLGVGWFVSCSIIQSGPISGRIVHNIIWIETGSSYIRVKIGAVQE
ncbi:hypothetical protein ACTXM3_03860, partial [Glutamicibacter arilaitensis]